MVQPILLHARGQLEDKLSAMRDQFPPDLDQAPPDAPDRLRGPRRRHGEESLG